MRLRYAPDQELQEQPTLGVRGGGMIRPLFSCRISLRVPLVRISLLWP